MLYGHKLNTGSNLIHEPLSITNRSLPANHHYSAAGYRATIQSNADSYFHDTSGAILAADGRKN